MKSIIMLSGLFLSVSPIAQAQAGPGAIWQLSPPDASATELGQSTNRRPDVIQPNPRAGDH